MGYSDGGREGPDDAQDRTIDGRIPRRVHAYVTPLCRGGTSAHLCGGSLTAAFTDIVKAFPTAEGGVATPVFGPSGVLREKIEHGDRVDILASADMAQPRTLARSQSGSSVVMFTRNRLCVLGRSSVGLTSDTLLDRLLDPSVRLATSTPGADPGGDYAWAVFARAEAVHPGAEAMLQAKAMKLVGGPNSAPLVADVAPCRAFSWRTVPT